MNFFSTGIPLGRYWGITVRLHFTFLIYAWYRAMSWNNLAAGLLFVVLLYGCILLHEFGHALAARWCDGEATDILLWPLGGLASVRPAFHPTAQLITTVAGPFVTLVLWLVFWLASALAEQHLNLANNGLFTVYQFLLALKSLNFVLLIFNLLPVFPMDGGRILRDGLWYWLGVERATSVAVWISRCVAGLGIVWAAYQGEYWIIFLAVFILLQSFNEQAALAFEARGGQHDFSIRDRLRRGRRQRVFRQAVCEHAAVTAALPFHRCTACGRTEHDSTTLDFRVCPDCASGEEYCLDHLESHRHL